MIQTPGQENPTGNIAEGATSPDNTGVTYLRAHRGGSPESFEANIARYFWNLYDTTTIDDNWCLGGADVSSHSVSENFGIGDQFPSISDSDPRCVPGAPFEPGRCFTSDCSGDREERTQSNPDGRNLWDYLRHASSWNFQMYVNRVDGQTP